MVLLIGLALGVRAYLEARTLQHNEDLLLAGFLASTIGARVDALALTGPVTPEEALALATASTAAFRSIRGVDVHVGESPVSLRSGDGSASVVAERSLATQPRATLRLRAVSATVAEVAFLVLILFTSTSLLSWVLLREAVRYTLHRRVLLAELIFRRTAARVAEGDFSVVFAAPGARPMDQRVALLKGRLAQHAERTRALRRQLASLLRTEPDPQRRERLAGADATLASGPSLAPGDAPSRIYLAPLAVEARMVLFLTATAAAMLRVLGFAYVIVSADGLPVPVQAMAAWALSILAAVLGWDVAARRTQMEPQTLLAVGLLLLLIPVGLVSLLPLLDASMHPSPAVEQRLSAVLWLSTLLASGASGVVLGALQRGIAQIQRHGQAGAHTRDWPWAILLGSEVAAPLTIGAALMAASVEWVVRVPTALVSVLAIAVAVRFGTALRRASDERQAGAEPGEPSEGGRTAPRLLAGAILGMLGAAAASGAFPSGAETNAVRYQLLTATAIGTGVLLAESRIAPWRLALAAVATLALALAASPPPSPRWLLALQAVALSTASALAVLRHAYSGLAPDTTASRRLTRDTAIAAAVGAALNIGLWLAFGSVALLPGGCVLAMLLVAMAGTVRVPTARLP
jgi:hypothetical protein